MFLTRIINFFFVSRMVSLRLSDDMNSNRSAYFHDARRIFKSTHKSLEDYFIESGRSCDQKKVDKFMDAHPLQKNPPTAEAERGRSNERALTIFHDVFQKVGLPTLLAGGSALGFFRNCGSIPGDKDIDVHLLGSWIQDNTILSRLATGFEAYGGDFSLSLCPSGISHTGCEARVTFNDTYGDIFFLEEEPCNKIPCSVTEIIWPGGEVSSEGYAPCTFQANFESVRFLNRTFWAPSPIKDYLLANYGEGFDEPNGGVYKNCDFQHLRQPQKKIQSRYPSARAVLNLEHDKHQVF